MRFMAYWPVLAAVAVLGAPTQAKATDPAEPPAPNSDLAIAQPAPSSPAAAPAIVRAAIAPKTPETKAPATAIAPPTAPAAITTEITATAIGPLAQSSPPSGEEPASEEPASEEPAPPAPASEEPAPTPPPAPTRTTAPSEPQVLVAEVAVEGVTGALLDRVYDTIRTRPGQTTTRSQLQEDINRLFATGLFSRANATPADTPLGVRVTFTVQANPTLRAVRVNGASVIPQDELDRYFQAQYGQTLNLNELQASIERLNTWYRDNGYVLAQVVGAPQISEDGIVTLELAEGTVNDIQIVFLDEDGQDVDEDGNPIEGRTRDFIILREMTLKPGDVFNRTTIQSDLQRVFGLGIFEDVQLRLEPAADDPRKVNVLVSIQEKNTAVLGAEAGFSSASGVFGAVSFQEQNLGGNNQRLGAEVQFSERGLGFDISFSDPWIAGDPYRTSYTVNLFSRRSISLIFDGGDREIELPNGDRPRLNRLGGRISITRPLANSWTAYLATEYQNVAILDADGDVEEKDELGNDLSFSGTGKDNLWTVEIGAVQDRRDDRLAPTRGSVLRLSTEQSIPIDGIFFNRLRGSYSRYFPVNFTNFSDGPETLAFNIQGGAFLGDLPPYEAFPIGGTNTVRGYGEGEMGSGRYYVVGTVEYRFPILQITENIPLGGVLFVDVGSDLGSGSDVPGDPAGIRRKPGSGIGFGVGVRARTPFGPLRLDYGVTDDGDSRIHFGIGERF
ncbi:MAG: BamA/TamA family outer membrane protein [Cyanophyceae cyanobacterium]